jgi:superfamily I DNA/RNA helicase
MYIGDLAQQTQLGTIRSWKEIGEDIPETRHVHLHKVYRNTKEILRYIAHRGYSIDISPQLPEGKPVITKQIAYQHLNTYIQDHITAHGSQHIGLLFEEKHLAEHVAHLSSTQIHILSMTESQGLEFDIVYIFASPATKKNQKRSPKFEEALQHIKKDMWYVAMTRAMKELIIVELT